MNIIKYISVLLSVLVAMTITACAESNTSSDGIDQDTVCVVSEWKRDEVEAKCQKGSKLAFLPRSWGNEQLPILFAAANCDLRYSVALTHGGVVCIHH